MKANRRFRRAQDDGASVIVGAVLLFALSFLVLAMIQSNFVPVWEQDAEAAHAQTVQSQLAFLKSQMERQVAGGVTSPLSSPIDLDRPSASQILSSRSIPPGILSLDEPGSSSFRVSSPELNVATVTDPAFVGVGEAWDEVDGDVIEDASRIASLRVRFGADAKAFTGEWAYLDITDADGLSAGRLGINLLAMSTNQNGVNRAEFWISTENGAGEIIGGQYFEANNQQIPPGSEPDYAWVNAVNPDYRFDRLLGSAKTPFDITLTTTGGLPADFSAAYYQATAGGGEVLVGGGSETITDYDDAVTSGRLVYDSLPQYFVDQDLILEYGAILTAQDAGASVSTAPALAVGTSSSLTSMTWTIPHMTAGSDRVVASNSGLVVTTASNHQILTATGPEVTLSLDTEHPRAWTNHWRTTFELAGLTEGTEYSVSNNDTVASLTISGPKSDTSHDVTIALQTATVEVHL